MIVLVGIPGLLAPIGTTVMGVVAISSIRHSRGRITGLPLAVADSLFFPMLLLLGIVTVVVHYTVKTLVAFSDWRPEGVDANNFFGLIIGPSLILTLILGFFIVRATWRAAKKPVPGD